MKVELNLARAESRGERYALAWAVPALALGLAGLLYLGHSATHELGRIREVRAKVAAFREQDTRLRERESALRRDLDQPQFREVFREVQFVNGLIERKQLSLTELAARVTKLLPQDARLAELALVPQTDQLTVRFVINAKNEVAVENFVSSLEDSPDFKDPVIANQGFEEQGSAAGPVTVSCSARYVPEAR